MDITFFITSLSSGGAEHQVVELAKLLVEKGYNVTISTFADVKDHYEIPYNVLRKRIGEGKGRLIKLLSIIIYFMTVRTDCVISFGQRASFFCLALLFFRRNVRIIAGERSLTVGKPDFYGWILTSFLYYRADYIVSNSYSQSKYLCSVNNKLKKRVKVIINYTDTSIYMNKKYIPNEITRIGIFSRYSKVKNYERFVDAIRALKSKTSEKFVIEWYGNIFFKDKEINSDYANMNNLVKKYNLTDTIKLNGHIKNVQEVLPDYDAICLPSIFEGFSNSISEAISCGRPMIVSDVSDNKLMVQDGVNGFLFDPYSTDDMVNAFLKFLHSTDEERREMSLNSRIIAEKLFDKEKFVNSYIALLY